MEEHHRTKKKRVERVLLLLTILLAVYTLFRVSLSPQQPLILESVPAASVNPAPLLDLNQATAEELECLPGIGPVLAQRILDYREEAGPFTCEEDVLEVPGIGDATYEKFSLYITFR